MTQKTKKEFRPKLRFPEFRDEPGWAMDRLGDHGEFLSSLTGKSGKDFGTGNAKFVPYTNVFQNTFTDASDLREVDVKPGESQNAVAKGDVFFTVSSETPEDVGMTSVLLEDIENCYLNSFCTMFRFEQNTSTNSKFVGYLLRQSVAREHLSRRSQGSTRFNLSKGVFRDTPLLLPSGTEQSRIAECLSSLDELIAAHERKLELLKDYKKGLMQSLFPRPGETQPRLRFPEFRDGPEWTRRTLASTCDLQAGTFVPAAEIYTDRTTGLYPCYGGNGLRGYTKSFTHKGKYSLIGRQGALCGNINQIDGQFHATEHALVVYPKDGIDTDWLYHLLGILNLNQYAIGQAQPGLSVGRLKDISLHAPIEKDEQHEIADCLSKLDQLMNACSMSIDGMVLHKKGLMQQLFPSPVSIEQDD